MIEIRDDIAHSAGIRLPDSLARFELPHLLLQREDGRLVPSSRRAIQPLDAVIQIGFQPFEFQRPDPLIRRDDASIQIERHPAEFGHGRGVRTSRLRAGISGSRERVDAGHGGEGQRGQEGHGARRTSQDRRHPGILLGEPYRIDPMVGSSRKRYPL